MQTYIHISIAQRFLVTLSDDGKMVGRIWIICADVIRSIFGHIC